MRVTEGPLTSLAIFLVVTGLLGCTADPEPVEPNLIDHGAWSVLDADEDPYSEHRPADDSCPESAVTLEGTTLEVDTGLCLYATFEQPALIDADAGTPMESLIWHSTLASVDPAEAHILLEVNGEAVRDEVIAIPAQAEVLGDDWSPSSDIAAGDPVRLHLHNHGANTWNIGYLRRVEEAR